MRRTAKSFSARLTGRILLLASILYIIAISIIARTTFKTIEEDAFRSTKSILEATTLHIDNTLGKVETATINTQWMALENLHDTIELYHITQQCVECIPDVIGCAIALDSSITGQKYLSPYSYSDAHDNIFSKELGNNNYNYYEMDWYKIPMQQGKPKWCKPYFDEGGGEWLMSTYSIPIKDSTGHIYGIATADISLHELTTMIAHTKPYDNSYTVLIDREGNILSDGRQTLKTQDHTFNDTLYAPLAKAMRMGETGTMKFQESKDQVFAVYGPVNNGWSVAVVCPYKDVFAHTIRTNNIFLLVSILALVILCLLCMVTIRKLLKPVSQLTDSAISMAHGNLSTQLPEIKTQDELGKLRDSMDFMQKSINSYIEELKTTTAANERMESELNIARKIQLGMVPHEFPESIYASVKPAKEVGGDLYDFFFMEDKLYFAIGDVSGKGVPAALVMAITKAAFRFIAKMNIPIHEVVAKINKSLSEANESSMFVTFFAGCLDTNTGEIQYCNAGHNPMVIIPPKNAKTVAPYFLETKPNLTIGLMPDFPYVEECVTLEKGSRIVLYTDGVTEAENVDKVLYGEDRLLAWAQGKDLESYSANNVGTSLLNSIEEHAQGAEQNDDITIMIIDFK